MFISFYFFNSYIFFMFSYLKLSIPVFIYFSSAFLSSCFDLGDVMPQRYHALILQYPNSNSNSNDDKTSSARRDDSLDPRLNPRYSYVLTSFLRILVARVREWGNPLC